MRLLRQMLIMFAVLGLITGPAAIAGGLYVRDNVQSQLKSQQISFAPKGSPTLPADIQSYGGTQVVNGSQAKVFADKYIAVHVKGILAGAAKTNPLLNGVTTYSQISSVSRTHPGNKTLSGLTDTVFRGEMLRGSLLSAWGWWTMATIMLWAGVALLSYAVLAGGTIVGARLLAHRSVTHRHHEPAAV